MITDKNTQRTQNQKEIDRLIFGMIVTLKRSVIQLAKVRKLSSSVDNTINKLMKGM